MLLDEIIEKIEDFSPKKRKKSTRKSFIERMDPEDLKDILYVTAKSIAVEEAISAIALGNSSYKGSNFQKDIVDKIEYFGLELQKFQNIKNANFYLPFFISSLGPNLVNVADTFFSAKYYKDRQRSRLSDKDAFYSYYRSTTATALGLTSFSKLNEIYEVDMVYEILKNALGLKGAMTTMMPQHVSYPELGIMTETSIIGGSNDEAIEMAIGMSALRKSENMFCADDSIVYLQLGDAGTSEPNFVNAIYNSLKTEFFTQARHFLDLSQEELTTTDFQKQEDIYQRLFEATDERIKLVINVADNGRGIS